MTSHAARVKPASLWGVALVLVCTLGPWLLPTGLPLTLLIQSSVAVLAFLGFHVLYGQAGLLSFGHALYVGVGAYAGIFLLKAAASPSVWVPLGVWTLPFVGAAAAAAVAALFSLVSVRHSGTSFAMVSFGLAELVWAASVLAPQVFGGEGGLTANRSAAPAPVLWGTRWDFSSTRQVAALACAVAMLGVATVWALSRTRAGMLINAMRDEPSRVQATGHNPAVLRAGAMVIAGALCGASGGLFALQWELVSTEVWSAQRSGAFVLFAVLAGCASMGGALLAAVLMVLCTGVLATLSKAWLLHVGVLFIWVVLRSPAGLMGVFVQWPQTIRRRRAIARAWSGLGVASGAVAVVAYLVLAEMAYHWPLAPTMGSGFRWLGLSLNTAAPSQWLATFGLTLCGAVAARWAFSRAASGEHPT